MRKTKLKRKKKSTRKRLFGGGDDVFSFFGKNALRKEGNNYVILCGTEKDSTFSVSKTSIELINLSKCGEISGTTILKQIINMGKDLHKETIVLQDESKINLSPDCRYDLSYYKILLTGQSWYNQFGFVSVDHTTDMEHNERQRTLPFHEFVDRINTYFKQQELEGLTYFLQQMQNPEIQKRNRRLMETYSSLENYKEHKTQKIESSVYLNTTQFIDVYSDLGITEDMPVYIVVQLIDAYLKKLPVVVCDDKIRMLIKLITGSRYMLKYTFNLVLTL